MTDQKGRRRSKVGVVQDCGGGMDAARGPLGENEIDACGKIMVP